MAIAMAKHGGIGIIHRFLTVEDQVDMVRRVKRSENIVIENPYIMTSEQNVEDAKYLMDEEKVGGILIKDNGKLLGIITSRDLLYQDSKVKLQDIMSKDLITAPYGISIEEAKEKLRENRIEKLPLVDEQGNLKGLITNKDIGKIEKYPHACKDKRGRLIVGAAVGIRGDYLERTKALMDNDCDLIVVDVAHGHSNQCINAIKEIKKYDVDVMAGNVATSQGFKELVKAGADSIRVGVGNGTICTTRIVTGCGVPQITAIMDCSKMAKRYNIPLISDGGTKNSGDIVKAIAAGASGVMIGSQFAGTEESPGKAIIRNGRRYKMYRGSTSFQASVARKVRVKEKKVEEQIDEIVPEGVESFVPYKGRISEIIYQLIGGIKSGLSYCGVNNLKDAIGNVEFIKMTSLGLRESNPHDVDVMK
jgi:IMP dehydrogenase